MFKLLIVDDEPTVLRGLTHKIPWQELNVTLVGEASNGKAALELAQQLSPDLVLTDIRMPEMDGLALTRALAEHCPQTEVIILTGYADFSYAQEALRIGVADYVLKPTAKDKIIAAVQRAQQRLTQERRLTLLQELPALQAQFLELVTRRLVGDVELTQRMAALNLQLEEYRLAAFRFVEHAAGMRERNLQALKNAIVSVNAGCTYFWGENTVLSVFSLDDSESAQEMIRACEEICTMVEQFSEGCLCAGISQPHQGATELADAAEEALCALAQHFYTEETVLLYTPVQETGSGDKESTMTPIWLLELETALEQYEFEAVSVLLEKLFSEWRSCSIDQTQIVSACMQVYYLCVRVLKRNNHATPDETNLKQLLAANRLPTLEKLMTQLIAQTQQELRAGCTSYSEAVLDTKQYIQTHYAARLYLSEIAQSVFLNPHHLCRLFKKECGQTINEYITRVRVDAAKQLLQQRRSLSYAVGEAVGFNDPAYFSMVFKKVVGQSPKEYQAKFSG